MSWRSSGNACVMFAGHVRAESGLLSCLLSLVDITIIPHSSSDRKIMAEVDVLVAETARMADEPEVTSTALTTTNTDGTVAQKVRKTKIVKRKRRPARPQQDPSTFKVEPPPQTGTIFNIWYNKWSGGDREDALSSKHQAKGRCDVARDSGYTRRTRCLDHTFAYSLREVCVHEDKTANTSTGCRTRGWARKARADWATSTRAMWTASAATSSRTTETTWAVLALLCA